MPQDWDWEILEVTCSLMFPALVSALVGVRRDKKPWPSPPIEIVRQMLNTLPSKEKQVLIRKFGLDSGRPRTNREIAEEVGVSRTRPSQVKDRALRMLRYQTRLNLLKPYIYVIGED